MKRSFVNKNILWARELMEKYCIRLPRFAYWSMDEWAKNEEKTKTVRQSMMGWDITDYGSGRFEEVGGVLFTLRNGDVYQKGVGTPYAEKYIFVKQGQKTPMHMHKAKTEDIINRCGGTFSIKLYACSKTGGPDYEGDVAYVSDGIEYTVAAGSVVDITNGNSITLTPGLYHEFWGKDAPVVIGEVSTINDDNTDNYFVDEIARFSDIIEDEPALCPLCNEYA